MKGFLTGFVAGYVDFFSVLARLHARNKPVEEDVFSALSLMKDAFSDFGWSRSEKRMLRLSRQVVNYECES
ncbi:hypothetical protein ACAH01_11640 [Halomicrobium sp. HM KBTZ05]|uniref:hypothetical protein n=1 Tax=Halomicrobium sp. HM KBTZ05 TaxID=3242663 RepID=UPI0035579E88